MASSNPGSGTPQVAQQQQSLGQGQDYSQPYQPAQVNTPQFTPPQAATPQAPQFTPPQSSTPQQGQYQPSYTPPSAGFTGPITNNPPPAAPAPAAQNNYGYNQAQIQGGLMARAPFGVNPADGTPFATAAEGAHPYAAYAAQHPGIDQDTGLSTPAGMAAFQNYRAQREAADTAREQSFGFSGVHNGPPPNSNPWSWGNSPTPTGILPPNPNGLLN